MAQTMTRVFISSTSEDLKAHREMAEAACREVGFFPVSMKDWPALDAGALKASLGKLAECDVYLGIFGFRYGHIPEGQTLSITELEFDEAVRLEKPRLLFVMDPEHPMPARLVETGAGAEKLKAFKAKIEKDRVRALFTNPENLKSAALSALHHLRISVARSGSTQTDPATTPEAPSPRLRGEGWGEGPAPRVDITHLPAGAPHFLGREAELAQLDAAWASQGKTAIVELIAPGGTGKTALAKRWVENLKLDAWRGARRVFAWSFYSQGTSDDRQASEDHFLAEAVKWFGVDIEQSTNPVDKGRAVAEEMVRKRTLLVLDGLEPLQYPPGPLAGELRAPGLKTLLAHAATAGTSGLILLTSREWLKDLDEWVRSDSHPAGAVLRLDLGNLSEVDGGRLLHAEGAHKAGESAIGPEDGELQAASQEVKGHALTLTLLARYLRLAHDGDIRRRDVVDFQEADAEAMGGHTFKVIKAYERWFQSQGEAGARELAALRLLGFFDRPASKENLAALSAEPTIAGLTEALAGVNPLQWRMTLKRLQECRLIEPVSKTGSLDAHPLVREYFAAVLENNQREAWKEGHRRIYEQLKQDTPHRPDTLAGLQPLYQAVSHGCKAGLYQEACDEVYDNRILRGTGLGGFYSWKKLGAFGANLGAVACFFVEPWWRLAPALKKSDQTWLLNEVAIQLRALGRLAEALEPLRIAGEINASKCMWANAAVSYSNLSQLELSLGRVREAVTDAETSLGDADRSRDALVRIAFRTTLEDARHQAGDIKTARLGFAEAEGLQSKRQPDFPLLYSMAGFRYCELLLALAERASWRALWVGTCSDKSLPDTLSAYIGTDSDPQAVAKRAAQTLAWGKVQGSLLDIALDHLTLARCALYGDLLQGCPPGEEAQSQVEAAVSGLRAAAQDWLTPLGLLTRAWLRFASHDETGAQADLEEAQRIASRGGMKLHLADIALTRARLFRDRAQLQIARQLIEECGYGRRIPELQDAEEAAKAWPKP